MTKSIINVTITTKHGQVNFKRCYHDEENGIIYYCSDIGRRLTLDQILAYSKVYKADMEFEPSGDSNNGE